MTTVTAKPYNEALMDIVEAYQEDGQPCPASKHQIADWAIERDLWQPQHNTLVKQLANDLAVAMKVQKRLDPQGRRARTMAAVCMIVVDEDGKKTQIALWDDSRTCAGDHLTASLEQRHHQIGGDCKALHIDCCSGNDNNRDLRKNPIQFSWDFTEYVESSDEDDETVDPQKPR